MNKKRTITIVTTGLFALAITPGAIMNIVQPEVLVDMAAKLGLPLHLMTLVGVWKLLGVGALIAPGVERLREWAYAGFFFSLTGASYLHAIVGDTAGSAAPLVILGLLVASYAARGGFVRAAAQEQMTRPGLA